MVQVEKIGHHYYDIFFFKCVGKRALKGRAREPKIPNYSPADGALG